MWLILIVIGIIILLRLPGKYKLKPENFPGIAPSSFQKWKSMDILSDQTYLVGLVIGFFTTDFLLINGDDLFGEGGAIVGAIIAMIVSLIPGAIIGSLAATIKKKYGIK